MMEVEHSTGLLDVPKILAALLDEFSAMADYRALRDNLPRRLARLLRCRCVLLYQRMGETLHFVSGSVADQPGWSATLLAVAHINPIEIDSETPEAQAWRTRRAIVAPLNAVENSLIAAPLIYRQRAIGVLTAIRSISDMLQVGEVQSTPHLEATCWSPAELPLVALTANVTAMLLENTRLLERDRERIHELSLLNSITSQMNCSLHEPERVYHIVLQRAREIALPDFCDILLPDLAPGRISWIPPELQQLLLQRWLRDVPSAPLVLERMGDGKNGDYMDYLSPRVKTFFALPLSGKREGNRVRGEIPFVPPSPRGEESRAPIFGVLVGAYQRTWKLRRTELVLLQVLTNQASAILENITLMRDVLEARNESRSLLRQVLDDQRFKELVLECIPSGLLTTDNQGRITTFNRAAEAVLGYHPREVLGQPVLKILNLSDLAGLPENGQARREALLTSGRQGQEIALDITLVPLRDEQGNQVGALATFADVTAIHQFEKEKLRLARLASLGEMAASMAHEVRNPLASIKTSIQLLLEDLEEQGVLQERSGVQEAVAVVLKEVGRLDSIVRDLLLFARPRQLHLAACDIMELSERILHFLQPQCDERGVRIHFVRQNVPTLSLDVVQMEQVLMNLFLNALQAMPEGGVLTVTCQVIQLPAWDREKHLSAWLDFTVSDTGVGISQENLEHIFQPFFTTRAHGIGLGLPITRRLVEDHRGYLLVESQLGYGTTISVRLPLNTTVIEEQVHDEEGEVDKIS